jgi:hypothetical protein
MRKLSVAAAFALTLAVGAVAQGNTLTSPQGQTQSFEASQSSNKAGKGTKLTIDLGVSCNPAKQCQAPPAPIGKASPLFNSLLTLPKGLKLGYKDFPKCDPFKLERNGLEGCPKNTRVGKGTLVADGRPVATDPVNGSVTAFNGTIKNGKGRFLLYLIPELSSPLVLTGTLNGSKLNIPVPPVPTLPGQPNATLTKFHLTVGAKIKVKKGKERKTVNYLTNPKKCPSGGYAWSIQFSYENLEKLAPTDKVPCKK